MEFLEYEPGLNPDISKNYFTTRAQSLLSELYSFDFRFVSTAAARFYSSLYAGLRLGEALQSIDLAESREAKHFWRGEHNRWQKALKQKEHGDYSPLAWELNTDSVRYLRRTHDSPDMTHSGFVLLGLSETLFPG